MSAPSPAQNSRRRPKRGILYAARRRVRLITATVVLAVVFFALPSDLRQATRALIAWNAGAGCFLVLIAAMCSRTRGGGARSYAALEDENQGALLVFAVLAAGAAMAAIVWELGPVKDLTGALKAEHIGLAAATLVTAWAFIHTMFALHYAGEYYAPGPNGVRAGLRFPEEDEPDWGEFLYQAFVIGCACATADVNATSRAMRRVCVVHGVVAFFFNTIILALTINIGAGLF
ncbi:MAG: DUF1345 domain-containing protein [Hyphomicrobiales bacterium]|nr:DUF1345 domain-containing protein [Hyphomicrobiales bacterium]